MTTSTTKSDQTELNLALLPPEPTLIRLPLGSIKQGINPRTEFDRDELSGLAQSLKDDDGPVQPIVVYHDDDGLYGLIAGERRWRAAKEAGLQAIHAIVRVKPPAHIARKMALKENMQRADLTPYEIALAVKEMLAESNEVGAAIYSKSQLADELGKDAAFISRCEALLLCSERLKLKVHHGKVPLDIAAMIGSLPPDMHEMAEADIVDRAGGCMTVVAAREHIAEKYRRDLRKGQFDKAAADLIPGRPPCHMCEFNGARRDDIQGKNKVHVCLNPACFDQKQRAFVQQAMDHSDEGDGVKMLGDEMREKIFSFDGKTVKGDSGYVAADEVPDKVMLVDPNAKTGKWEDIVEGRGVTPVKIIDGSGRVRTLYPADVAVHAAVQEGSKVRAMFKATAGAGLKHGAGSKEQDGKKKAASDKARANGVIAAGQTFVQRITASADIAATSREIFRLILERLTEPVDREWMGKVMGVKDPMDAGDKGMMTEVLGLALVARSMRLQGPVSIAGCTGELCKLIGFDAKKEARLVEQAAKKTGSGGVEEKRRPGEEETGSGVVREVADYKCDKCGAELYVGPGEGAKACLMPKGEMKCAKHGGKWQTLPDFYKVNGLDPKTGKPILKTKKPRLASAKEAKSKANKRKQKPRHADKEAEDMAWQTYLDTGSITKAASAAGVTKNTVRKWHQRRGWKEKRDAAVK